MKKIEKINKAIHDGIMKNFYSRLIDWYRVVEVDEGIYKISFYKNFIIDEDLGLEEFKNDIEKIVEEIENNVIIKIENEIYLTVIYKVDCNDSTVEIKAISRKIN